MPSGVGARVGTAPSGRDRWLLAASKRLYRRRVTHNGTIKIGGYRYYVGLAFVKQEVALSVNAPEKQLMIYDGGQLIKPIPLKGLYHGRLELADYIDVICREAISEARRLLAQQRYKRRRG